MARPRRDGIQLAPSTAPEGLLGELGALGLSRNEALAYLTLLEDEGGEGLTGYEVAARSSIPRSAVYTVLRKLQNAGAAFEMGEDPVRFVATEPATWLATVRRSAHARIESARSALASLPPRSRPEPVWILRRYDEVMGRIDEMIRGAEQSVWISLWGREVERLQPAFEAIADRPLHRVLHSPAGLPWAPPGFSAWVDTTTDDSAKSTWSHKALVVVDRREALIGGTEPNADNHAVWTSNPSLVDVATNHIILDITLMARARDVDPVVDVAPMMRPHLIDVFLEHGPEALR
jgi:hypothetical protein